MNKSQLSRISRQSRKAPGLPYFPNDFKFTSPRFLKVEGIHYDYLPMNIESPKMFYVTLRSPPPRDLQVGSPVRLHYTPGKGIQTTMSSANPRNSLFEVDDIVGHRVILSPYKGSTWLPTVHSACDSHFGWGYSTKFINKSTSFQGQHNYGYGTGVSFLEYQPIKYTSSSRRYDMGLIEEDWYRGDLSFPGWQHS